MTHRPLRPSGLALRWGALWGMALGFGLLAPRLLAFHRLAPAAALEWLVLDLSLASLFAILGALLGFCGCAPLVIGEVVGRRRFGDRSLAYGLGIAFFGPLAYLAAALGIEALTLVSPIELGRYLSVLLPSAAALLAAGPVLILLYRRLAGRAKAEVLRDVLVAATLAGFVFLPLRAGRAPTPASHAATGLSPVSGQRAAPAPLLVVGIDGGNWSTLQSLLDRGELPTLASIVDRGIRGSVAAIWPPYWSSPGWAAILTGFPREETGIYEDLAARAPGLPEFQVPLTLDFALEPLTAGAFVLAQAGMIELAQPSRRALAQPPFWELFERSGLKTAVVRFPFTSPASNRSGYMIADRVGRDTWSLLGIRGDEGPEAVWPPAEATRLLASFSKPLDPVGFSDLVPRRGRPQPPDALRDPLESLEIALAIDQQTFEASQTIVRAHAEVAVVAAYLGGLDGICHAFWQYRFPREFPESPPAARDVAELGGVIDRYWKFLDGGLGQLIAAFPRPPNVVVVADHGMESIHTMRLWKGWHSSRGGIFLAAGPDVPQRRDEVIVSYFDIVPTLADVMGFAAPEAMRGRSLLRGP